MAKKNENNEAKAKAAAKNDKWSQRARFTSPKGARLDVFAKKTAKGFQTGVSLRRGEKKDAAKVPTERGMLTTHASQEEAVDRFNALVADARKNGWQAHQMVTRTAFVEMPKADKV
jgi:hypothetical protein